MEKENKFSQKNENGKSVMSRIITEEQKDYLSTINSGENGYWYGKNRDEETKEKIRQTKLANSEKNLEANTQKKKVGKFNSKTGELEVEYLSASKAEKALGLSGGTVSNICKGKTKQKAEYILRYI